MFLSGEYIRWLERLPCNRHARRRQHKHGQWLEGWVPEIDYQGVTEESEASSRNPTHAGQGRRNKN